MEKEQNHIVIFGAGLVGTLLAIFLAKKGFRVSVYEKRNDIRYAQYDESRSINLALSDRGWRALREIGLEESVKEVALPVSGRMMHDVVGNLSVQPYGKDGQVIYSVSRFSLNRKLIEIAREYPNISFFFNYRCLGINFKRNQATVLSIDSDDPLLIDADYIFGADGAFSQVRQSMQKRDLFNYEQFYIEHGYKEFHIDPLKDGTCALDCTKLHIWPRGSFMLMALPNPDGTFTGTLFFPFKGELSFETVNSPEAAKLLFEDYFPDVISVLPDYQQQYMQNPTSSLVTIKCYPWTVGNATLIGDAAHAIVPFFGQGMNAGFEDCYVLNQLIDQMGSLDAALTVFGKNRKPSADAIAELALQNFIEMRDYVSDPKFLFRKKIEAKFHELYPTEWKPLYSMVTFSDEPYEAALAIGKRQDRIMNKIMAVAGIENSELTSAFVRELWYDYVVQPDSKL